MRSLIISLAILASLLVGPVRAFLFVPGSPGPAAAYVDASHYGGSDLCAQITAAGVALYARFPAGGTVDARGITGTQTCAASISSGWPNDNLFAATILLGRVTMQTVVTQTIPSGVTLKGISAFSGDPMAPAGTMIQAQAGFPINSPVIEMGLQAYSTGVVIKNLGVSCQPPSGANSSGCIGIRNRYAQEKSTVEYVTIHGGTDTGLAVEAAADGGPQNSGPYRNIGIGMNGVNSATATCMRIGNAIFTQVVGGFYQISCGGNANVVKPNVGIEINAAEVTLRDSHIESVDIGVQIGTRRGSSGVMLGNIDCIGGGRTVTSCVEFAVANQSDAVTLQNIYADAASVTNTIRDLGTFGLTITTAQRALVSFYLRDLSNQVWSPGNAFSATTPTPTSGGGAFGAATSVLRTQTIGRMIVIYGSVTITTVGGASGSIKVPLPFVPVADGSIDVVDYSGTFSAAGYLNAGDATLHIWKYDGSSAIVGGHVYKFMGFYERG